MSAEARKAAQQCLAIQTVTLRHGYTNVRDDFDPAEFTEQQSVPQSFHTLERTEALEFDQQGANSGYRFVYTLGFRLVGKNEDAATEDYVPQMEIVGSFNARYQCARPLTEQELDAFSKDNVAYHVWPYWREYLQSMAARMGVREVIAVPMYQIGQSND